MAQNQGGPPRDYEPTELYTALMARPRPYKDVEWPGTGSDGKTLGTIRLWVATVSELLSCRANAQNAAKEMLRGETKLGDMGYEDIYRDEVIVELLSKVCRDPKADGAPCFPSAKWLRQQLTVDEMTVLVGHYNEHQRKCGPIIADMSAEELEAWIDMLVGGASEPGPLSFARLSSEMKTDLILGLAARLRKLRTASGSAGSPPGESSLVSASEVAPPAASLVDDAERAREPE
jgi:hypothetical protein